MTDKKGPLPLEPEAILLCDASTQLCHMVSIAISLKRIADAVAPIGGMSLTDITAKIDHTLLRVTLPWGQF